MRILFVLENYPPHIGGVELLFRTLCEGLAARGHDVTVVTHRLPGTRRHEVMNGVQVVRVPCMDSRYLFTFLAIPYALRHARGADIIHTTTYNGAFPAWIAAMARKIPAIITVHETWKGKWREYTSFSLPKVWLHELLEWCVYHIPRFDRYVCVSQSTKRMLGSALPGRKGKMAVIRNGFDPEHWERRRPQAKELRKKLGIGRRFVILAYGRPGTSKGFEYLVDAFPMIRERIPGATLILILSKDKQYRHKINEFKEKTGDDVLFLDPQPYDMLPAFVQMADCVVVPSISEGFGYAVLEAAAAGTPVVASNTTSIPEVIYGKHVLVRPRDPQAIAEGVWKVYAKEHAITPKRSFPWSRTVQEYERLYARLVKRP